AIAEAGRRRAGGAPYFPVCASAFAPLWLLERGVTAWFALGSRVFLGGVLYRGNRLRDAATSAHDLRSEAAARRAAA
ncbi:MAG TPA: glycosyltransferase family 2 protein, partial [Candidatus Dormibacteraeota bacterium]|nr:glycosyltransferase family 2 protein [Candidatus Dormibacteraeota bacterium]